MWSAAFQHRYALDCQTAAAVFSAVVSFSVLLYSSSVSHKEVLAQRNIKHPSED